MSVIDLLTRVDTICKKYDKYDVAARDPNVSGDDAFARLYASVESDIDSLLQKSEMASSDKSRASAVAINAEIRRTKARLHEEVPKLQRLAVKKVKGLSTEEFAVRNDLVLALPDRIQAIPDGSAAAPKPSRGWETCAPRTEIKFDSVDLGERVEQKRKNPGDVKKPRPAKKLKTRTAEIGTSSGPGPEARVPPLESGTSGSLEQTGPSLEKRFLENTEVIEDAFSVCIQKGRDAFLEIVRKERASLVSRIHADEERVRKEFADQVVAAEARASQAEGKLAAAQAEVAGLKEQVAALTDEVNNLSKNALSDQDMLALTDVMNKFQAMAERADELIQLSK